MSELKWINVENELPPANKWPVLTAASTGNGDTKTFQTAWYSRPHGCWYAYPTDKTVRLSVTHWMDIGSLMEVKEKA